MKVNIHQILDITKLDYINFVDAQFNDWCSVIAKTHFVPNRTLYTNVQLYNWFLANFNKRVVVPFIKDNTTYIEAGVQASDIYKQLFTDQLLSTSGIYSIYPSVLIKKIRKSHYEKINAQSQNS